jgi:hypothetical protein
MKKTGVQKSFRRLGERLSDFGRIDRNELMLTCAVRLEALNLKFGLEHVGHSLGRFCGVTGSCG